MYQKKEVLNLSSEQSGSQTKSRTRSIKENPIEGIWIKTFGFFNPTT